MPTAEPLVPSILLLVESEELGDSFGSALAGVGDVDGDSVPDFLVGAKFADPGGIPRAGRASLRSGATGEELLRLDGEAMIDNFGRSVAGIGDISGDGVPDLLIGASGAILNGQTLVGRASVHSGANGQELFRFEGEGKGELFGWAVAGVGDVTGDGVAEMAVGSFSLPPFPGRVSVYSGSNGSEAWRAVGELFGIHFGAALATTADIDDDGILDLLVGVPFDRTFGLSVAGSVRVLSGVDGLELLRVEGDAEFDALGATVAALGDLDGDGVPDFLVGAPPSSGTGRAQVFSGHTGEELFHVHGNVAGDGFGRTLAGPGDMDGDGVPDFAIGSGEAIDDLVGRLAEGELQVFSGGNGAELFRLHGADRERLASALSQVGDLNGDGRADLLVGVVPQGDIFNIGRGKVFAVGLVPLATALGNLAQLVSQLGLPPGPTRSVQGLLQAEQVASEGGQPGVTATLLEVVLHILEIQQEKGHVDASAGNLLRQLVAFIQDGLNA